jgi:hypothetical protein
MAAGYEEATLSPKLPHEESLRARRGPVTRLGDGSIFLRISTRFGGSIHIFLGATS